MTRVPTLLDLCCKQGGAAVGYHRAGWDVVGVDTDPQPLYPFEFRRADALTFLAEHGHEFDAIHASVPCQAHTTMSNRWRGHGGRADQHTSMIAPMRAALNRLARPWVIENVPGARGHMRYPVLLSGGMFGLRVDRPRLFETSFFVLVPPRVRVRNPVGVYGEGPYGQTLRVRVDGTRQRRASSVEEARQAMGIDWMDWAGLTQAIPPAYTEYIGGFLMGDVWAGTA